MRRKKRPEKNGEGGWRQADLPQKIPRGASAREQAAAGSETKKYAVRNTGNAGKEKAGGKNFSARFLPNK